MSVLALIGRILFVGLFLSSGIGHLTKPGAMVGYAAAKGLPAPRAAVIGSGVLQVVGALMVLLGIWGDLGALLLFVFLIVAAPTMHAFWKESDPQARTSEMTQFFKDIALAGASLLVMALFNFAGSDLGITITGPLF
jgi:putative oxidoreductase